MVSQKAVYWVGLMDCCWGIQWVASSDCRLVGQMELMMAELLADWTVSPLVAE